MDTIEKRIAMLATLGAGDQQCRDCLDSQAPGMNTIAECKKCIADTPAFTALIQSLVSDSSRRAAAEIGRQGKD